MELSAAAVRIAQRNPAAFNTALHIVAQFMADPTVAAVHKGKLRNAARSLVTQAGRSGGDTHLVDAVAWALGQLLQNGHLKLHKGGRKGKLPTGFYKTEEGAEVNDG